MIAGQSRLVFIICLDWSCFLFTPLCFVFIFYVALQKKQFKFLKDVNLQCSETPKRRSNTKTDDATMEEIKELTAMMSASDWRDRYKGITTLLEMCEMNSQLVASNVIKVTHQQ